MGAGVEQGTRGTCRGWAVQAIGWLASWLVGWLAGWLVGWLIGRLAGWLVDGSRRGYLRGGVRRGEGG